MLWNLGKLLANGYFLLLTVAAGGFVGANVAAFVPVVAEFFFNPQGRATPPATMLHWLHGGWLAGAGLALMGAVLQRRRSANRTARKEQRHQHEALREKVTTPRGVFASAGVGALCCGLLG